jgi:hypothetical protein
VTPGDVTLLFPALRARGRGRHTQSDVMTRHLPALFSARSHSQSREIFHAAIHSEIVAHLIHYQALTIYNILYSVHFLYSQLWQVAVQVTR